ncbi:hypothetical protein DFH28DRAFT_1216736 [Melampsora americana]|nr:hypothetical protein DFH28DRAFT_1216736 [Melampsora americana]
MLPEQPLLYTLKPINPYSLLPVPTRHTKQTGLLCSSPLCRHRPHSTLYYQPTRQPNGKLIGIRCQYDPKQRRTYFLDQFKANIHAHNTHIRAMNFDPQLTGTPSISFTPTPPPRPSNRRTKTKLQDQCTGVKGQFATGHTLRKNHTCVVTACRDCCDKLKDPSQRCLPHGAMAKFSTKRGNNSQCTNRIDTDSDSAVLFSDSESYRHGTFPRPSQAGRTYSRLLLEPELAKFKSISIQKQAEERTQRAHVESAKKQVTLIVWTGREAQSNHVGYWGGIVYAPQWPLLALNQSEPLMQLVHKHLGTEWNDSLQVWNEENQIWLHIPISMLHQYSATSRKILILFPDVDLTQCKSLDWQLASVSLHTKGSMSISKFLTPSPRKTDSLLCASSLVPEASTSIHSPTIRTASPATPFALCGGRILTSMREMGDFLVLSHKPKATIKSAWTQVYASYGFPYKRSTVGRYRRWLELIKSVQLEDYLSRYDDKPARHGKRYFHKEWVASDTKLIKAQPTPAKRVKL